MHAQKLYAEEKKRADLIRMAEIQAEERKRVDKTQIQIFQIAADRTRDQAKIEADKGLTLKDKKLKAQA